LSLRLIKSLPLLFLLAGCAGKNPLTVERPNARTSLEERSYNLMLTSETLLDTAEACDTNLEDGCEIAEFMRPVLSLLETTHNQARTASLIYVAFLDAGQNPEADATLVLENLLLDLDRLITRIVSGGGGE